LLAESRRISSQKLGIKELLMGELAELVRASRLKQVEAAEILGVTRPRVSDAINKRTGKFTIDALVEMVARTGKRVHLSVA